MKNHQEGIKIKGKMMKSIYIWKMLNFSLLSWANINDDTFFHTNSFFTSIHSCVFKQNQQKCGRSGKSGKRNGKKRHDSHLEDVDAIK